MVYFEVVEEAVAVEEAPEPEPEPEPAPEPESPDNPDFPETPVLPVASVLPVPVLPVSAPPSPAPEPAVERARVVSEPYALGHIEPKYPRTARRKGHEGNVTLEVKVASDGTASSVVLVESCGYAELDEAAVAAVRTARFAPAREDGAAISGSLRLTFDFRLR